MRARYIVAFVILAALFTALALNCIGRYDEAHAATSACTTVAVVGDSLTAASRDITVRALAARGYTAHVYGWSGRRSLVDNIAWNGTRIPSGLEAIATVRANHSEPDCWVIALGTNDVKWKDGRAKQFGATFHENNTALIDGLLAALGPDTGPVYMLNLANDNNPGLVSTFNTDLAEQADGRYHVIDWATPFAEHPGWSADGVHVHESGSWWRAQIIARAVDTYTTEDS